MALWHCGVCGAAHPVLCVSAVRERVRGARFVVLCAPFAWQTVPSTLLASVFMCASLIDFSSEEISPADALATAALAAQLVRPQCSTTSVTQRIDQA